MAKSLPNECKSKSDADLERCLYKNFPLPKKSDGKVELKNDFNDKILILKKSTGKTSDWTAFIKPPKGKFPPRIRGGRKEYIIEDIAYFFENGALHPPSGPRW